MISRVRKSFIKITMIMLTLVLIIPLFSLNFLTAALTYNNNREMLKQIAQTEIYILDPRMQPPSEIPPDEMHNIGIGKQQTAAQTSEPAVTTAYNSSVTASVTTAVNNKADGQDNSIRKTQPAKTETKPQTSDIKTDVPPPFSGPLKTRPFFSDPYNEWTHPTMPDPGYIPDDDDDDDDRPPKHDPWYDYPYVGYDDSANYGALFLSSKYNRIAYLAASQLSGYSAERSSETALTSASDKPKITSETTSSTTKTTTVSEAENLENQKNLHKKVFDKNFMQHKPPKMEQSNTLDHFIVYLDKNDTVTEVHGTDDYTIESCTELIADINDKSKYEGYYNSLQYVRKNYSQGAVVVFSDRNSDLNMIKTMLLVTSGVFILMEGIVFILTRILTKRAMRPMQISYEKQQQFISDAGHELKTPLTVISANADILSDEIGENKWLSYIKSQAERMRILVQEMLDLTRITNSDQQIAQSRFNISSLIENVALPFECQAFEQKKAFHIELEPDVEFFGNTERIRRMIGIFIDNAFKYSNENGTIKIQLTTENGKKILKIYNTGIGIQKGEEEKIFERFYRSDSSRSAQGGYGLGLAIAKSIADQNGIKIQVQTEPGQWISFNLTL